MKIILSYLHVMAVLVGLSIAANPATAESDKDQAALIGIIEAIEKGWEEADGSAFRQHYLDFNGARYFESGGQNRGLDDLINHHVEPEGDAFSSFDLSLTNIETHFEGGFAWALADVELKAVRKSNGAPLHVRGYETFLFRHTEDGWKVVHTHSSTRALK